MIGPGKGEPGGAGVRIALFGAIRRQSDLVIATDIEVVDRERIVSERLGDHTEGVTAWISRA